MCHKKTKPGLFLINKLNCHFCYTHHPCTSHRLAHLSFLLFHHGKKDNSGGLTFLFLHEPLVTNVC